MIRSASLTITEGHGQTIPTPSVHNNCHEKLSSRLSKHPFANNSLFDDNNIAIHFCLEMHPNESILPLFKESNEDTNT